MPRLFSLEDKMQTNHPSEVIDKINDMMATGGELSVTVSPGFRYGYICALFDLKEWFMAINWEEDPEIPF